MTVRRLPLCHVQTQLPDPASPRPVQASPAPFRNFFAPHEGISPQISLYKTETQRLESQ